MSGWTQEDVDLYYSGLKRRPGMEQAVTPPQPKMMPRPTLDKSDTIVIVFAGRVPSKKNRYTPNKDGKGMHKDRKLQGELDRLALQIPGHLRDLKLESPEVHFYFKYSGRANWDRDNACTALIDVLVQYGVLAGDQIRRFNGLLVIHPAEKSDEDVATVVLIPKGE